MQWDKRRFRSSLSNNAEMTTAFLGAGADQEVVELRESGSATTTFRHNVAGRLSHHQSFKLPTPQPPLLQAHECPLELVALPMMQVVGGPLHTVLEPRHRQALPHPPET